MDSSYSFIHDGKTPFQCTEAMQEAFNKEGFIVVRGLLSPPEMTSLVECFTQEEFLSHTFYRSQGGQGGSFRMALWWKPGDDTCGIVSRCKKIVGTFSKLLGQDKELYLLSSKLIMKEPHSGGPFCWH